MELEVRKCARLMVEEARAFEGVALRRVIFAVFGGEAYEVFSSEVFSPVSEGR